MVKLTPLLDLGIFLAALVGFTAFYGLERLADASAPRTASLTASAPAPTVQQVGDNSADPPPGTAPTVMQTRTDGPPTGGSRGVQWLHLGSFMIYNGLITYTMPLRLRTGVVFAVLFTVAMGLHFVLTDRGLEEHYPHRFGAAGRAALAVALLAGWLAAALVAPTSTLLVALLTALLGGSILLNVFKEEIPSGRRSSFPWFLAGLTLYAGLLTLVTALNE